ncbi:uncharacterized protein T551_00575 [Pneumocystis jirovecii RU7]|uniref:RING-type domain-containing protein n=1 Tax=Pneumocystis jirovecii (strain RU7) TaxID=1408657 RepID=A0A0W4ZVT0_PNEJ7|nr:uncharacterized protein T551_00575 [Pneumocystis jirovecii RU7]KTW32485.1 hypothetical protein T551_00575 [Pneumocystis jirovecii RU7]
MVQIFGIAYLSASTMIFRRLPNYFHYGGERLIDSNLRSKFEVWIGIWVSPFIFLAFIMAIVLNRCIVYASVRRPVYLNFWKRLLLRFMPIILLSKASWSLLSYIKFKNDPIARYIPRFIVPYETPYILWSTYKIICFVTFMNTLIASLQMRLPLNDHGMTIFEYAVSFTELNFSTPSTEMIFITFLSVFGILLTQFLCLFNIERFKLISSTIIGCSFLSYFSWSIYNGRGLYFSTTVCVSFIPHLITIFVIVVSLMISLIVRLIVNHSSNLRTDIFNGTIFVGNNLGLDMSDDFFGLLLKFGMIALTSAQEAVFLNEVEEIKLVEKTWIEESDEYLTNVNGFSKERKNVEYKNGKQKDTNRYRVSRWQPTIMLLTKTILTIKALVLWIILVLKKGKIPFYEEHNQDNQDSTFLYDRFIRGYEISENESDDSDFIPSPSIHSSDDIDWKNNENIETCSQESSSDDNGENFYAEKTFSELFPSLRSLAPFISPEHEESRILQSHMTSHMVVTRSKYREILHSKHGSDDIKRLLETIKDRRQAMMELMNSSKDKNILQTRTCVICCCSTRNIVLWPCRCLALCDDCRKTLAMRNFKECPCCRQLVISYSRIWIP